VNPGPAPPDASGQPPAKRPFWKNPFFLGFLVGIGMLTVLPFLQRKSLRAPPPLASLAPWSLATADGSSVGSESLAGKVWIASFCVSPCQQQVPLSQLAPALAPHTEAIWRVTVVIPAADGGTFLPAAGGVGATVATGSPPQLQPLVQAFLAGLSRQTGLPPSQDPLSLAQPPRFALVDQEGAVRGFWPADELGKGNVINAALMLARYGPRP